MAHMEEQELLVEVSEAPRSGWWKLLGGTAAMGLVLCGVVAFNYGSRVEPLGAGRLK